tara:strand:+ start:3857 stop:4255 length:399 start_codon:yes stop_codon:yes gene_type:complete
MSLETSIHSMLSTDTAIKGQVSDRVSPYIDDEGTEFPRIAYRVEADERVAGLIQNDSTRVATVQVDCIARSEADAATLSGDVEEALRGTTPTGYSGVVVIQDTAGDASPPFDGSRDPVYTRTVTTLVFYWES